MDGSAIPNYSPGRLLFAQKHATGLAIVGWLTLASVIVAGAYYGTVWRRQVWENTQSIRFVFDINNGFSLGRSVVLTTQVPPGQPIPWPAYFTAYLDSYGNAVRLAVDGDYQLDYAPGRLLIMSMWVKGLWERNITAWNRDYATTAPLLHVNFAASALTAIAMGLLVRHWRRYRDGAPVLLDWRRPWREFPAVLAMGAVWLNPALIWNTHAWPQWDCWLLPFFVFGVLAISKEQWLLGGFLIACGAIFKGQVLMTGPVLILWAVFTGRPLAAVRFLVGVALLASLVALVWIAREPTARLYLAGAIVASAAGGAVLGLRGKFDRVGIVAAVLAGVLIATVVLKSHRWPIVLGAVGLIGLVAAAPRWTRHKLLPALVAAGFAGAVFLAGAAWGEPYHWYEVSYNYPVDRRLAMAIGPITNLPAILARQPFHWNLRDTVLEPVGSVLWTPIFRQVLLMEAIALATMLAVLWCVGHRPVARVLGVWAYRLWPVLLVACLYPWGRPLPMRHFLVWTFGLTLVLCAIGGAIHYRRRSPRVLLALMVPWLLMFALMPQLHERYLLWAAVLLCVGFGLSPGYALLALVVTFLAWVNMANSMVHKDRTWTLWGWTGVQSMVRGMMPGAAWAVLLAALVYLYLAVAPEQNKAPAKPPQ